MPRAATVDSAQRIALLGIPWDGNSSFLRGAAQAPRRIREALYCDSSNLWSEDGVDLGRPNTFYDAGDVTFPESGSSQSASATDSASLAFEIIESAVGTALSFGYPLLCLGGDHSITYPVLKALHRRYGDLSILHFDAHPDLYHVFQNNPVSHACPIARIMESGLARRLMQVGIRTANAHQVEQAAKFGVEMITMRNLQRFSEAKLEGPLFISFDVDALDPAYVPGISHPEPGGLSVRQGLEMIQGLRAPIVGADLIEYNPVCDRQTQTAMVCAKLVKEISAAMLRRGLPPNPDWP